MSRSVLHAVALCGVLACSNNRSTTYFASDWHDVDRKLLELSGHPENYFLDQHSITDANAPDETYRARAYRIGIARQGLFDVEIVGNRYTDQVCRLHIGPNRVRGPMQLDFIYNLIDDPRLERDIKLAIGSIDIEAMYLVEQEVDGVRIRFEQFDGSDGARIEFLLDGCDRRPSHNYTDRWQDRYKLNYGNRGVEQLWLRRLGVESSQP